MPRRKTTPPPVPPSAPTTATSKQFSVNTIDLLKGLLMAVGTPVVALMLTKLESGSFDFDWKSIGVVALAAFLTYIGKNFLSKPRIVITDRETVESVKDGEATVKVVAKK